MTATEPWTPGESGRRRSDATKAVILSAARERFAADGYDRTTIRAIAADANIDPAMVMRYYGNKEKLFAAAADFDLRLPDLAAVPYDQVGARVVEHFMERWEEDDTLMALLRAAATNAAAAERMRRIFLEQVAPALSALSPNPAQADIGVGLLGAQMLGVALCRYVLKLPPIAAMSRTDLVAWLGPTIQLYITADRSNERIAGG